MLVLFSCRNDEDLISPVEKETSQNALLKEGSSLSLWKEDETYIRKVQEVYAQYADENYIFSTHGTILWEYAMTMDTFNENYLIAPVVKDGKVIKTLEVFRVKGKVYFQFSDKDPDANDFFQTLVFTERDKISASVAEGKYTSKSGTISTPICRKFILTVGYVDGAGGEQYPIQETKTICKFVETALPDSDCLGDVDPITGECGGGGTGGAGGYNYPDPPDTDEDPCEKLKAQTSNFIFKENVTTLEGKTGESYESGFRISNLGQSQLLQNKPGSQQVDMKVFSNTVILMHSHYDGLYPIFSPGDIIFFNQWIVWAQNWNAIATNTPKIPLNNLTFTLVTSNGNYSFTFDGTSTNAFPNYTQQQMDDLNDKYIKLLSKAKTITNVSGEVIFNMEKLEEEFLKFMDKEMNMIGIKLYKTTDTGNSELKLVNGNREKNDCPQ
ncbi:hypothetical protein RM51_10450 [Chryseobacterium taiwanense]|uniref:Uncharacterized protein n=2 Tax=Chryseobacterium taiwanense TaxID=363331 RepID=A0A0B4CP51_9FLAO|nr:hypothetical protein RM51_10450 [Chryseobacterium taiwanense]